MYKDILVGGQFGVGKGGMLWRDPIEEKQMPYTAAAVICSECDFSVVVLNALSCDRVEELWNDHFKSDFIGNSSVVIGDEMHYMNNQLVATDSGNPFGWEINNVPKNPYGDAEGQIDQQQSIQNIIGNLKIINDNDLLNNMSHKGLD